MIERAASRATSDRAPVAVHHGSGRAALRAELRDLARRCLDGDAARVLVQGEAGVGKSWLLQRAQLDARALGLRTLWARASSDAGAPALWPFVQLLRQCVWLGLDFRCDVSAVARELGAFVPELATGGEREAATTTSSHLMLVDTIVQMLLQAARQRPLCLLLEDVQDFDSLSREVLSQLLARAGGVPCLIVTSRREPSLASSSPAEPCTSPALDRIIHLEGLELDEVEDLLAPELGGAVAAAVAPAVHARTQGNPLYVKALAPALRGSTVADATSYAVQALPPSLLAAISQRLAALPGDCIRLLGAAAILGRDFERSVLARVAALPADRIEAELARAQRAGLIRARPAHAGGYEFVHALVREGLAHELGAASRAAIHARAARALRRRSDPGSALRAMQHWLASGSDAGCARALVMARAAAGRAADRSAHLDAASCYELALQTLERLSGRGLERAAVRRRKAELLHGLALSTWRTGYHDRARAHYLEIAEIARESKDAELLALAAIGCVGSDVGVALDAERMALCEEACASLPALSRAMRARLLATYGCSLLHSAQRARGVELVRQAEQLAVGPEDVASFAALIVGQYYRLPSGGDVPERERVLDRASAFAERARLTDLRLLTSFWRFGHLLELGDGSGAAAEAQSLQAAAERYGDPLYVWLGQTTVCTLLLLAGDWANAEAWAQRAFESGRRAQSPNAPIAWMIATVNLRRWQGRGVELVEPLRALRDRLSHRPEIGATLAAIYAELGRFAEARLELDRVWAEVEGGTDGASAIYVLCQMIEAAYALGDAPASARLYARLAGYEERCVAVELGQSCDGSVAHYLALAATTVGDDAAARGHFTRALSVNAALRAGPALARTQLAYARLLARPGGDLEEASRLALAARQTCEVLGLTAYEQQIDRLPQPSAATPAPASDSGGVFRRNGDVWQIEFAGRGTQLRDDLGLRYLALLLASPVKPVHVLDLLASAQGVAEPAADGGRTELGVRAQLTTWESGLDARCASEYRRRERALEDVATRARECADEARARAAERELAFLHHELRSRARFRNPSQERARKAVYNCIRRAIERVSAVHPALGRHLRISVRTGASCVYRPEPLQRWSVGM